MTGDVGINVLQRKTVQTSGAPSVPIFASRLLVSEANVSTMLFLSAPRSTDLKSDNVVLSSVQRVLRFKAYSGFFGERVLVLGRLTEDCSFSVQRLSPRTASSGSKRALDLRPGSSLRLIPTKWYWPGEA